MFGLDEAVGAILALSGGNYKGWDRAAATGVVNADQVWTETIIPAGKISSTLAWRWAMPCS